MAADNHDAEKPTWGESTAARRNDSGRVIGRWVISPEGVLSYDGCIDMHKLLVIMNWSVRFLVNMIKGCRIDIETFADGRHKVVLIEIDPLTWSRLIRAPRHRPVHDVSILNDRPLEDARFHISNAHTYVL